MRNWDLREFRVGVNLTSPLQQVRGLIWCVITLIRVLLNPTRQVVPLLSYSRSYPPPRSLLHLPSLSFLYTTLPLLQNTKLSHFSLSLHGRIMSWHWIQYTQSTVSTKDCLCSLHSHDYELTPECSFSFRWASLQDHLSSTKVSMGAQA